MYLADKETIKDHFKQRELLQNIFGRAASVVSRNNAFLLVSQLALGLANVVLKQANQLTLAGFPGFSA